MEPELDELRAAVRKVFPSPQAAEAFLRLDSPALGGVPLELARAGRLPEVLAFLERLAREAPPEPSLFGIPLRRLWGR